MKTFASISIPVLQLMTNLISVERRASYEMFRVEVVETGAHHRMRRLLGADLTGQRAESQLLTLLPAQLAADLSSDPISRITERTRLDLLLTLAIATADQEPPYRPVFYVVCDVVTIHKEQRARLQAGTMDSTHARRHLVAELARLRAWYAEEIRHGHH